MFMQGIDRVLLVFLTVCCWSDGSCLKVKSAASKTWQGETTVSSATQTKKQDLQAA